MLHFSVFSWVSSSCISVVGVRQTPSDQSLSFLFTAQIIEVEEVRRQLGRWLEPWSLFSHTTNNVHAFTSSSSSSSFSTSCTAAVLYREEFFWSCRRKLRVAYHYWNSCTLPMCEREREKKLRVTLRWSKAASVTAWGTAFPPFLHSTSFFSSRE